MQPESETILIERAKSDPEAFAELYRRYVDRVYAYLLRRTEDEMLAQDITAGTFERALCALPEYEDRGLSILAWFYTIARNLLTSHQRRRKWLRLRTDVPSPLKLEWLIERDEQVATLRVALAQLSARDREILLLRFFEDLPNAEIAAVLGCRVDAVYVRLHRALRRLEKRYQAQSDRPALPVASSQLAAQRGRIE